MSGALVSNEELLETIDRREAELERLKVEFEARECDRVALEKENDALAARVDALSAAIRKMIAPGSWLKYDLCKMGEDLLAGKNEQ